MTNYWIRAWNTIVVQDKSQDLITIGTESIKKLKICKFRIKSKSLSSTQKSTPCNTALCRKIHGGETWQFIVLYERAYQKEDVTHFYPTR